MALISRIKTWVSGEILTASDLNSEFDNVINNGLDNDNIVGSSADVTEMRVTVDPGEVGTESLASNNDGEIKRLRNQVKEIVGNTQWYESPPRSLQDGQCDTAYIAPNAVTRPKLEAVGEQTSSLAGNFTVTSTTFAAVTGLGDLTITTSGRPVVLMFFPNATLTAGNGGRISCSANATPRNLEYRIRRDSTLVSQGLLQFSETGGGTDAAEYPTTIMTFDAPTSGTYVYSMQMKVSAASGTSYTVKDYDFVAYEL